MSRARLLRLSIGLANSLSSTQQPGLHLLCSTQVTRFFHLTTSTAAFLTKPHTCYNLINLHQILFFSSKPESFIDLVLSSGAWSNNLETELGKLNPKLTHESIVYVLVNLKGDPQKSLDFFKWACAKNGFVPRIVHYGLLLRSLACKEFIDDFWVVASEMKQKLLCYDHNIFSIVHERLIQEKLSKEASEWSKLFRTKLDLDAKDGVKLILGSDWDEQLEGVLREKLRFPMSDQLLMRMLVELSHQPLIALKFFDWVGSRGGYEHDSVTYNAMARVLAKQESVGEFWNFVQEMRGEGYEMDTDTYTRAVRHLPSGDAARLFEFMMDGPYKPSLQHCSNLLCNITRDTDLDIDSVHRVVRKFVGAGNVLTKSIYDGVHRALCNVGNFDEAKKIVEDLKGAGYEPDNVTYSQEIFGLCKHRKLEEACKVLENMEAEGCAPDIKTWTILIEGLCFVQQMDQALSCLAKMKEKGVEPDAKLLHVLIQGFVCDNKLMDAYKFLNEMVSKDNLVLSKGTYKLMIRKVAEAGMVDEALELFRLMRQQGHVPYADPITQYVAKLGTVDDAKKLLKGLPVKDGYPNTNAYVHLIRSFFEEGRCSEAKALVDDSPQRVQRAKEILQIFASQQAAQFAPKQAAQLVPTISYKPKCP